MEDREDSGCEDTTAEKPGVTQIGKYRIMREIGRGGMGVVYEARDDELGRTVALKTLLAGIDIDPVELERFQREGRISASMNHPGIVTVYEVGTYKDIYYFTMDYIDGLSLWEYVQKNRPSLKRIALLLRDVVEALAYAHSKNIIHRDIKPANILLDGAGHPHLTDFGLARDTKESASITVSGIAFGTPSYMPPEQAMGKYRNVDRRSDIYSLGAVLYHLLTGRPPFHGASIAETLAAVVEQEPVFPRKLVKGLPKDIETICLKCLEKVPRRRYPNARSLAADLDRFAKGKAIQARPTSIFYRVYKHVNRNKAISALSAFSVIAVSILTYIFFLAPGSLTVVTRAKIGGKYKVVQAKFKIDDREIAGALAKYAVAGGTHSVTVTADEYETQEFPIKISPGKEIKVEKELRHKKGRVTIESSVTGVQVSFSHRDTQENIDAVAPFYRYELDTGAYDVVFHKTNYFSQQRRLTVAEKSLSSLNVKLEPMLLWTKSISKEADISGIYLADLDCDGELELICSKFSGTVSSLSLQRYEKNWEIEQKFPKRAFPLSFNDMNRDGIPDIIVAHTECFVILDGKTHEEIYTVPSWWGHAYAIADANGDGYDDCILFTNHFGIQCHDPRSKKVLWIIPGRLVEHCKPVLCKPYHLLHAQGGEMYAIDIRTGQIAWRRRYAPEGAPVNIRLGRFPHTGKPALVWYVREHGLFCMDLETRGMCWKTSFPAAADQDTAIFDVNADGREEVLISLDKLYCLDLQSGKISWEYDFESETLSSSLWTGDLEGDGSIEVVVAKPTDAVYILNGGNGTLAGKFCLDTEIASPVAFDTDGDGMREILFAAARHVHCIRHCADKKTRVFDERLLLSPVAPAAADVNGDNYKDFIIGDSLGRVHCIDGADYQVIWNYQSDGQMCRCETADIDGDGDQEIIALSAKTTVTALDGKGERLWENRLAGCQRHHGKPSICDMDGDGLPEILIYNDNSLFCLRAGEGEIVWSRQFDPAERIVTRPLISDVDLDGRLDLVMASALQGVVYCVGGQDGQPKWTATVPRRSEAVSLAAQDIDKDGYPEIFIGQVPGYVSCLGGKNGEARWHVRLRAGNFRCLPAIADFDGDKQLEVIVSSEDEDLQCLDAMTGRLEWCRYKKKSWSSSAYVHLLALDIDGDRLPDIVTPSSLKSFYMESGQDGRWLGHIDKFGMVNSELLVDDLDNNGEKDIAFIDTDARLVCVYDAIPCFRRTLRQSQSESATDNSLIELAHINLLFRHQSYHRLEQEIATSGLDAARWGHVLEFFQGVSDMAGGQYRQAVEHFQNSENAPSSIFDNKYLQALACLNAAGEKQAAPILKSLMEISIADFDRCRSQYDPLLTGEARARFRQIMPDLIENSGCRLKLSNAWAGSNLLRDMSRDYLLRLSLIYALPSDPGYKERCDRYVQQVIADVYKSHNVYHFHEALDILDEAMETLPDYPDFLTLRARVHWETGISREKALADLDRSLSLMPDEAGAHLMRGQIRYEIGQIEPALADFQKCVQSVPEQLQFHIYEITALLALGKNDQASRRLDAIRGKIAAQGAEVFIYQLLSLLAKGHKDQARALFEANHQLAAADPWLLQSLVRILR